MVSLSEPVLETTTDTEVNPVDVPDMDVFKLNMSSYLFLYYRVCPYALSTSF